MAFYPDVLVGDTFQPSARRENDISHLLNAFNETSGGAISCGRNNPYVSIPVQMDGTFSAGVAVNISAAWQTSSTVVSRDFYFKGDTFSDAQEPWGVPLQSGTNSVVQCAISGICFVSISSASTYTAGKDYVEPNNRGIFEYSSNGFPLYIQAGLENMALADISRAYGNPGIYWAVCQSGTPTQGLSATIYDMPGGSTIGSATVYGEPFSTDVVVGTVSLWVSRAKVKVLKEEGEE